MWGRCHIQRLTYMYECSYARRNLSSSDTDARMVDLIGDSPTLHPASIFCADATVSCPLLPHYMYLDDAFLSSSAIFNDRARHKTAKHGPVFLARLRFFIPFVWSHLAGFGLRSTLVSGSAPASNTPPNSPLTPGYHATMIVDQAYTLLFQVLHKIIITHHHHALYYLSRSPDDPHPPDDPDPPGPPAQNP